MCFRRTTRISFRFYRYTGFPPDPKLSLHTKNYEDVYQGMFYTGYKGTAGKTDKSLLTNTCKYFNSSYKCNSKNNDNTKTFEFTCHRLVTEWIGFFAVMK